MSTDTAPSPLPEPLPKPLICGHCLMEITHQSGLRYFGTSVAHQEYECLRLLHAEIERLTAALAAAEADARIKRAERDWAQTNLGRAVKMLSAIHTRLYPPTFTEGGKTYKFQPPNPHEFLQELSDRIRAIPDEIAAIDAAQKERP